MEEIIYVVTAGCYSDYHIGAIFKDKKKAEHYCTCHEDCEIEEWEWCDESIFTPFDFVDIFFDIYKNAKEEKVSFNFRHLAKEDNSYRDKNTDSVMVYSDKTIRIHLSRRLPKNYNEEKIRQKYIKACQDLKAEILYLISESDCSTYEKRTSVEENMKKYLEGRFGIEVEDEDLNEK